MFVKTSWTRRERRNPEVDLHSSAEASPTSIMDSENSSPSKQDVPATAQRVLHCVDNAGTEHLIELRPWHPSMTLARVIYVGEHVSCAQFPVLAHGTDANGVTTLVAGIKAFHMQVQVAPQADSGKAPQFTTSKQPRDPVGDIVYRVLRCTTDGAKVQYDPIGVVVKALKMEVRLSTTGESRVMQDVVHIRVLQPIVLTLREDAQCPAVIKKADSPLFETEWGSMVESQIRLSVPSRICVVDEDAGTMSSATLGMLMSNPRDAHADRIGLTVAHLMPPKTVPTDAVFTELTLLSSCGAAQKGDSVLVPVAVVFAINQEIDSMALTMLTPRSMPALTKADGSVEPFRSIHE
jgi:hypothetical protein